MSWTFPVLAIVMTVCAAGCGNTASSDEYEVIDNSQTIPGKPVAEAGSEETVEGSTQAGSSEPDTSNSQARTEEALPVEAGPDITATAPVKENPATPGGASPEEPGVDSGKPEAPETGTELTVIEPREVKLLVPERTFRKEGRERALRVTFDDVDLLKILNMEPVQANAPEQMPGWLKDLEGKRIRLRGFMYPTYQDTDIEIFLLARDNDICCFGRSPKVYDIIKVSLKNGETTDYIQGRPFDVVGIFHIAEEAEIAEDALPKLYSMTDAVVIAR